MHLLDFPGNVLIPAKESGLTRDSVVNVSQITTINRARLTESVQSLSPALMRQVDEGLRFALDF